MNTRRNGPNKRPTLVSKQIFCNFYLMEPGLLVEGTFGEDVGALGAFTSSGKTMGSKSFARLFRSSSVLIDRLIA